MRITLALLFLTSNAWAINVGGGLRPGSVGTVQIADGAVNTAKLAADSVIGSKILNATIPASKMAAGGAFPAISGAALTDLPTTEGASYASAKTFYSSVTVNANFGIQTATFTVANGFITAPSQSGAKVYNTAAFELAAGVLDYAYWGSESWDRGASHDVTTSSQNIVARGAGLYYAKCQLLSGETMAAVTSLRISITVEGTETITAYPGAGTVGNVNSFAVDGLLNLTDGQAVACGTYFAHTGSITIDATAANYAFFELQKLW